MIGFSWQRQVALLVCDDILLHFFPVHIDGPWFEKVLENCESLGAQFKDPVPDGIIAQRFFVVYQWCFQWVARLHGGVAADDRQVGGPTERLGCQRPVRLIREFSVPMSRMAPPRGHSWNYLILVLQQISRVVAAEGAVPSIPAVQRE